MRIRSLVPLTAALVAFAASAAVAGASSPKQDPVDKELQQVIAELQQELEQRLSAIAADVDEESDDIQDDAPSGGVGVAVGFEVEEEMVEHTIVLHVPEFFSEYRKVSFHVPEVSRSGQHRIVIETPSTRMVRRRVGEYPQINRGRVRMRPLYAHVPETFMERHEVFVSYPEFRMKRVDSGLHVPTVKMKEQTWKIELPSITVKKVDSVEITEERTEKIERDTQHKTKAAIEDFQTKAIARIKPIVGQKFDAARKQLRLQKATALVSFDAGIAQLETAIKQMKSNSTDKDANHIKVALKQMAQLKEERQKVAATYDKALKDIDSKKAKAIKTIIDGFKMPPPA